jgi:hypothetical protein
MSATGTAPLRRDSRSAAQTSPPRGSTRSDCAPALRGGFLGIPVAVTRVVSPPARQPGLSEASICGSYCPARGLGSGAARTACPGRRGRARPWDREAPGRCSKQQDKSTQTVGVRSGNVRSLERRGQKTYIPVILHVSDTAAHNINERTAARGNHISTHSKRTCTSPRSTRPPGPAPPACQPSPAFLSSPPRSLGCSRAGAHSEALWYDTKRCRQI